MVGAIYPIISMYAYGDNIYLELRQRLRQRRQRQRQRQRQESGGATGPIYSKGLAELRDRFTQLPRILQLGGALLLHKRQQLWNKPAGFREAYGLHQSISVYYSDI